MSEIQSCFKRVEKKYMLTREQYKAMLPGMAFHMVPDEHPRYTRRSRFPARPRCG